MNLIFIAYYLDQLQLQRVNQTTAVGTWLQYKLESLIFEPQNTTLFHPKCLHDLLLDS
jgi:hypothetical protein